MWSRRTRVVCCYIIGMPVGYFLPAGHVITISTDLLSKKKKSSFKNKSSLFFENIVSPSL